MVVDPIVLGSVASGAGAVVGWLTKHLSNGKSHSNGNGNGKRDLTPEILTAVIETKTLTHGNSEVLRELAKVNAQMAQILSEVERRGRNSEEAIRRVLESR